MTFKTHVPMNQLKPEDARRILSGLSPVLETLRGVAARKKLRARPPRVAGGGRPRSSPESTDPGETADTRASGAARDERTEADGLAAGSGPVAAGPTSSLAEERYARIVADDLAEAFSDGTPSLGHFSLQSVQALTAQEWHRRLERTPGPEPRARAMIAALVVYALKPESPVRARAAEWHLQRTRRVLEESGVSASEIDRQLCELSCALWHVLLTAGISIERAVVLRDAIDRLLLDGVSDPTEVAAFSPALGPLTTDPASMRPG